MKISRRTVSHSCAAGCCTVLGRPARALTGKIEPDAVLIEEKIYDRFIARALERVAAITRGHPLYPETMLGAQASQEQLEKILGYVEIGKQEGAQCLIARTIGRRNPSHTRGQ
jgi:acyl-CoA reductase-like NAD-dependent aldehyde dehydrogenase